MARKVYTKADFYKTDIVPGLVYRKADNYQKAYKLEPFEVPAEWLDLEFRSEPVEFEE